MIRLLISHTRILVVAAALLCVPLAGCAGGTYRAEAIEGWVVDSETGKPLEGVSIVANWGLRGGFEGNTPVGQLQILEAVTDVDGRYFFPAWGPRTAATGHLGAQSPRVLFFKSGYKWAGFSNLYYNTTGTESFFYNKKTLKLEPFRGTTDEYARHFGSLNRELWEIGYAVGSPCGWEAFPKMLSAVDAQATKFRGAGLNYGSVVSNLRSNATQLKSAGCRSIDQVILP